jgi:alkyl sulfatase BDS1-like metallo-beta-lactamase superfamily hydrolase
MVRPSLCASSLALSFVLLISNRSLAQDEHFHPKGKPPSVHTKNLLQEAKTNLPFADKKDFEEQARGFIAAPASKIIKAEAGHNAWDKERYDFLLEGKEFDSIHPSLQRMSTLNMNFGLYKVSMVSTKFGVSTFRTLHSCEARPDGSSSTRLRLLRPPGQPIN